MRHSSKFNWLLLLLFVTGSVLISSCGGGKKAQTTAKKTETKTKKTVKDKTKKVTDKAKAAVDKTAKTDTTAKDPSIDTSEQDAFLIEDKDKWGPDSLETVKNYSLYREFFKQGAYEDAFPYWRYIYKNAPSARKTPLMNGEQMYKSLLDDQIEAAVCGDGTEKPIEGGKVKKSLCKRKANGGFKEWKLKDPTYFNAVFDTLLNIYKIRETYFGEQGYLTTKKARLYDKYKPAEDTKIKELRKLAIDQEAEDAAYDIVYAHFNDELKKLKTEEAKAGDILALYDDQLLPVLDYNADTANNKYADKYVKYRDKMNKKVELLRKAQAEEDSIQMVYEMKKQASEANQEEYAKAMEAQKEYEAEKAKYDAVQAEYQEAQAKITAFEDAKNKLAEYEKEKEEYAKKSAEREAQIKAKQEKAKEMAKKAAEMQANASQNEAARKAYEAYQKEKADYEAKVQADQAKWQAEQAKRAADQAAYKQRVEQQQKDYEAAVKASKEQAAAIAAAQTRIKTIKKVIAAAPAPSASADLGNVRVTATDCASAKEIYGTKFNSNPSDVGNLKRLYSSMQRYGCKSDPLYMKSLMKLAELEPTASRLRLIATNYEKQKSYGKAISYYEKSLSKETDNTKKGKVHYRLAKINQVKGSYSKARSHAQKAAKMRPGWGKPYMLIGNLYAASAKQLSGDGLGGRSVYWAAVDMYARAKSIDPSVAGSADSKIGKYTSAFPDKETVFFKGLKKGQSFKVGGWIGQTTKVRF